MPKMPNYAKMTLEEQLEAYNALSETKRKSKFKSVEAGAAALQAEWDRQNAKPEKSDRKPKNSDKGIKVLVEGNPRREGTKGHEYFTALAGSKTVGEYLARYEDPTENRDARLWMNSNIKAGHVELTD